MPLLQGWSKEVIQENIKRLIAEGYSLQQAASIAHEKARQAREKAKER